MKNIVNKRRVAVTTFPDVKAHSADRALFTLTELFSFLKDPAQFPTKKSCPLLKLASFGTKKTKHHSLRHDANVIEIDGVEGDYDAEKMPLTTAAERLRKSGLIAMLYTSPSHTPQRPRWRVLAPTSKSLEPSARKKLVARLNGVLGGVLASESFALSQSYYAGRVEGVTYQSEMVNGTKFIDQLDGPEVYASLSGARAKIPKSQTGAVDADLRHVIKTGGDGVHGALCSLSARLVGRGMDAADVTATLAALMRSASWRKTDVNRWQERFAQIPELVASAERKFGGKLKKPVVDDPAFRARAFAGPSDEYGAYVDRTDTGNVNKLVELTAGNLRYITETREWMAWRHGQWRRDSFNGVLREATLLVSEHYRELAQHYFSQAKNATHEKERDGLEKAAKSALAWEKQCRDKKRIDALCALAAKDKRLQISVAELDRDPDLLGVQNGVVDLRTGQLRDAARDDFVTKLCAVDFDPRERAPTWERSIREITGFPVAPKRLANGALDLTTVGKFKPRPDLATYLQRALGYSLTARTEEHKMFVCYGSGSNGKNIILDMVQRLLDGNCAAIPPDALMATRSDADAERPTSITASLAGARMAVSSESKDRQKLDAGVVKRHTGDSFMTARRMRENIFKFEVTHKLWLMTNNLPHLDHLDPALRGRLHIVPFDRRWNRPGEVEADPTLPNGDKDLGAKLKSELKGILVWLVRGAVEYFKYGLPPPPAVMDTTKTYFEEQNPVPRWIATLVRVHGFASGTRASALFGAFRDWCTANGERFESISQKHLSLALADSGIQSGKTNKGVFYAVRVSDDVALMSDV